jgi:predicted MFS family arabinose efflux permease
MVRPVLAASLMASAGAIVFLSLPLLVGLIVESHGVGEQEAGAITSAYFATYLFASASSVFWVSRLSIRRLGSLAYLLMASGLGLAAIASSVALLMTGMCVAGIGGGMLFSLGVAIIAESPDTDRNFGWLLLAQQLVAAAFLLLVPTLVVPAWGLSGALGSLALLALLFSPALRSIGGFAIGSATVDGSKERGILPRGKVFAGLAALVVHFAGLSALWAFVERIGDANGIPGPGVGQALSLSMLGGLLGALLVTRLGNRAGRQLPLWLSMLAFLVVATAYGFTLNWLAFLLVTSLLSFAWNFILAYQMSIVSELGAGGSGAVLIPAAQGLGAVIGPSMGGAIIGGLGQAPLLLAVGVICVSTLVVFSILAHRLDVAERVPLDA